MNLSLWRRGALSSGAMARVVWRYLRHNLGLLERFEDLKAEGARGFEGRDPAADTARVEALFNGSLSRRIHPEAKALIGELAGLGVHIAIVSSTHACTGRLAGVIPHQEEKARIVGEIAAAEKLDLAHSWAFGDSVNDVPMLEAVGRPVAVNPSSGLRRVAMKRGCEIARWGRGP